jgi:hypothetical protein
MVGSVHDNHENRRRGPCGRVRPMEDSLELPVACAGVTRSDDEREATVEGSVPNERVVAL